MENDFLYLSYENLDFYYSAEEKEDTIEIFGVELTKDEKVFFIKY